MVAAIKVAKRAVMFRLFGNVLPLTETQSGHRKETLEKFFVKAKARPDPLTELLGKRKRIPSMARYLRPRTRGSSVFRLKGS